MAAIVPIIKDGVTYNIEVSVLADIAENPLYMTPNESDYHYGMGIVLVAHFIGAVPNVPYWGLFYKLDYSDDFYPLGTLVPPEDECNITESLEAYERHRFRFGFAGYSNPAYSAEFSLTDVEPPSSIKLSTPTGLYADNITSDSARTNWQAVENASNYKVQYKAAGDTVWTETFTD